MPPLLANKKEFLSSCFFAQFIIPSKSLARPMQIPFSPNHRNGFETDLERRKNGGTKVNKQENCNVEITFPVSGKKNFNTTLQLITLSAASYCDSYRYSGDLF